ncbi:ABC transporter permease DevC [Adhaeretor mobilis]|uniref:FtsX-like permease family protein n=1 Tax=Adhaeretor mobilis TaxID=1930276 RepID=A0A517MT43_9BACT|nr:ABC transporter permease DevC [Adhaeretor mobilis]QDS98054.1 FtsX-like permease family protein [Adhaeretor mobilis]
MPLLRKTPLAWKNLTHDKRRLAVALAGIGFAVLLMFTQVGFQKALFDSQVKLIDDLRGDIFLVSKAKYTLAAEKRFPKERINQASSCFGVAGAFPIYSELTLSVLKNLTKGQSSKGYPIRSIGFHLKDPVLRADAITDQIYKLRIPNTALIDVRSKGTNFAFPTEDDDLLADQPAELAGKRLQLVGSFELGTDFAHDGNLVMSAENFASYFPARKQFGNPLDVVDLGVVHKQEDADLAKVRDLVDDLLPNDVSVLTREEYRNQEIGFWDASTPIGIIFSAGKIIGFVVGVVICYQVIYTDIADHMSEFATLRAMGYKDRYFVRMIVAEGVLLSIIGFIPGLLASWGLYYFLANMTGLQLIMTMPSAMKVLGLTILMCIASGLLAVRKLLSADPASLF